MKFCGDASNWAKFAFLAVIIGFAVHVAGFATPDWEHTESIQEQIKYSTGLWNYLTCPGGHGAACSAGTVPDSLKTDSFVATQIIQSIVLVLMLFVVFVLGFYVASARFRELVIAAAIVIMCFITVTLGIIGMIVWLTQVPADFYPGYSFGLTVLGFLLFFMAALLMLPDIRKYGNRTKKHDVLKVNPYPDRDADGRYDKYDEISNKRYSSADDRYNRNLKKFNDNDQPDREIRHYYNPNRPAYVKQDIRSPPPSYTTHKDRDYGRHQGRSYRGRSPSPTNDRMHSNRSIISTPDVFVGQLSPRRY